MSNTSFDDFLKKISNEGTIKNFGSKKDSLKKIYNSHSGNKLKIFEETLKSSYQKFDNINIVQLEEYLKNNIIKYIKLIPDKKKYSIVNVLSDGTCFYHAVVKSAKENNYDHELSKLNNGFHLRNVLCEYLELLKIDINNNKLDLYKLYYLLNAYKVVDDENADKIISKTNIESLNQDEKNFVIKIIDYFKKIISDIKEYASEPIYIILLLKYDDISLEVFNGNYIKPSDNDYNSIIKYINKTNHSLDINSLIEKNINKNIFNRKKLKGYYDKDKNKIRFPTVKNDGLNFDTCDPYSPIIRIYYNGINHYEAIKLNKTI